MEPITTSLVLGAVSFFTHLGNAKRNNEALKASIEAQESFEKEAQQKGFEDAENCFKILCEAKRRAENDLYEAEKKLSNERHKSAMMHIAEMFSFADWPLHVKPYVMRDDELFDIEESRKRIANLIQPLQIILSPSLNHQFNHSDFYSWFSNDLMNYFMDYWKLSSDHPVLFYQDAWINNNTSAEGSNLANIKEELNDIPTIVIIPQVRNDSIKFKLCHWNLIDGNITEASFSLPFNQEWNEQNNCTGKENGKEELCKSLKMAVSFIVDQHFWFKYKIPPRLPHLYSELEVDEDNKAQIYDQYVSIFKELLDSFVLSPQLDIKDILKYCAVIDTFGKNSFCFKSILQKLTFSDSHKDINELIQLIPKYPTPILSPLLSYCNDYREPYGVSDKSLQSLEYRYYSQNKTELINKTVYLIYCMAKDSPYNVPWKNKEIEEEFFGNGYEKFINDRITHYTSHFYLCVKVTLKDAYNYWYEYQKVKYLRESLMNKLKNEYYQNITYWTNDRSRGIIQNYLREKCEKIVSTYNLSDESLINDIISNAYIILYNRFHSQITFKVKPDEKWIFDSGLYDYVNYVISCQTKTHLFAAPDVYLEVSSFTSSHLKSIVKNEIKRNIELSINRLLEQRLTLGKEKNYSYDSSPSYEDTLYDSHLRDMYFSDY